MVSDGLIAQRIFSLSPHMSHFKASTAKTHFRKSTHACLRGRDCFSFAVSISFAVSFVMVSLSVVASFGTMLRFHDADGVRTPM